MRTTEQELSIQRTNRQELTAIKSELKTQAAVLSGTTVTLWGLEVVDFMVLGQWLNTWGVAPGKVTGLIGILTAPFLHGSFSHLAANTVPLLLFSWLIMLRDNKEWAAVTMLTMLTSGLGTWLIAPAGTVHIGASGLVFGYFGYLLTVGIFQRKLSSILMSLFIGVFYGGLISGMIPFLVPGFISWQMHLFGFLGGVLGAYLLNNPAAERRRLMAGAEKSSA